MELNFTKIFDEKSGGLMILGEKSTPEFWDKYWRVDDIAKKIKYGSDAKLIEKITKRFLKQGSLILEGGCGVCQNVLKLKSLGYKVYGVDTALDTLRKVKKMFPELNIFCQDVRKLSFPSNFFEGYWSLGVIEHFREGYAGFLKEASRVLKQNGYLFLAFPHMSVLRRIKLNIGFYKKYLEKGENKKDFYQFILRSERVIKNIKNYGFLLRLKYVFDPFTFIKYEPCFLDNILERICSDKNIFYKVIKVLFFILFSKIAGHSILLVFKKVGK